MLSLIFLIYAYCGYASYLHWVNRWTGGNPLTCDYFVAMMMGVMGPFAYLVCWLANVVVSGGEE